MFAGTTTNATLLVDGNYTVTSTGIAHQTDGRRRAMARTGIALYSLRQQAVVRHRHGIAYRDGTPHSQVNRLDSTCGTHLTASCAVEMAISLIKSHLGLQQRLQTFRRTQHIARTFAHTQLTARASAAKVLQALRTGRLQWHLSVGQLLVFQYCQSAVDFLLLCLQCHGGTHGCRGEDELTTRAVHLLC